MAEARHGSKKTMWIILAVVVIIVLAIIAFFALGGDADVDSEGDFEVPETDIDIEPPDVEGDVNVEEGGDAEAEVE